MTEFAGLDDLLDQGSREPVRRRGLPHLRWAVKALLASAALGAALAAVLIVLGFRMAYPVAAAGILAALTLHRVVVGLRVPRRLRLVSNLEREPGQLARDGLAPAVNRWQAQLRWDRAGLWRSNRSLQPNLAELVDERLRQRHGCTLADDPDRARTLLGERLWSYLTDPTARTPTPRDLATMLTTVEEL
jgi:hypothetical protein